jgi:TfoX/Sxy family transcriptional regulator of competence genes
MAYDEELANRIRTEIQGVDNVTEMRMFGGLAFLVGGNMAVAASSQGGLLLRVEPEETDALAAEPHTDRFVMRGREMNGWLRVEPEGVDSDEDLSRWVDVGVRYASSLPPK